MIVEIINADKNCNFPLVGEFYKAKNYPYDSDKVTLIYQIDKDGNKLDKQHYECSDDDPLINEYKYNIKVI